MKRNLKLIVVPFLLLTALGVAQVKNSSGRIKDALPAGINLTEAKVVEIKNDAGAVVLSGTFANYAAPLSSKDSATKAKGLAEIEIEKSGAATKQEIEVEVENLPALSTFKLIVDGNEVATFTTSKSGKRALKYTRKDH
jgi:hypothetical protein